MSESHTLVREGESKQKHGEKRVNYTVKKSRFQEDERGQAKRAYLGEVEGSMSR